MLCSSCAKLSFIETKRNCIKCKNEATISIAILCETCSTNDQICSICLKKTNIRAELKKEKTGCRCSSK